MFIQSYVNSNLNLSTLFIFLWLLVIRVDTCKFKKKGGGGVIPYHERLWDKQVLGEKCLNTGTKLMVKKCQFTLLILHIDNFLYFFRGQYGFLFIDIHLWCDQVPVV
jgi:hypothetical protein